MVVLLNLSSWFHVMAVWLFLAVSFVCLQFVIVVFPDLLNYYFSPERIRKTGKFTFRHSPCIVQRRCTVDTCD